MTSAWKKVTQIRTRNPFPIHNQSRGSKSYLLARKSDVLNMVVHHFCNFVYTFVFDCDRKLLIFSVFLQIFLLNRHKKGTKIESGEKKNLNDTPGKLLSLKCHKN